MSAAPKRKQATPGNRISALLIRPSRKKLRVVPVSRHCISCQVVHTHYTSMELIGQMENGIEAMQRTHDHSDGRLHGFRDAKPDKCERILGQKVPCINVDHDQNDGPAKPERALDMKWAGKFRTDAKENATSDGKPDARSVVLQHMIDPRQPRFIRQGTAGLGTRKGIRTCFS